MKMGGVVITHNSVTDCDPMTGQGHTKGFRWADGRRSLAKVSKINILQDFESILCYILSLAAKLFAVANN